MNAKEMRQKIAEQRRTIKSLKSGHQESYRKGKYDVLIKLGFLLNDIPQEQVDWKKVDELLNQMQLSPDLTFLAQ